MPRPTPTLPGLDFPWERQSSRNSLPCLHQAFFLLLLKEKYSRKNRRFQLHPPHTRHAVTCTTRLKDAKHYCLQNGNATWCCYPLVVVNLGFPCLYFALSLGVRQRCWVHQKRRTGCGHHSLVSTTIITITIIITITKRKVVYGKNTWFSPSFSAHTPPRHLTCYHGR